MLPPLLLQFFFSLAEADCETAALPLRERIRAYAEKCGEYGSPFYDDADSRHHLIGNCTHRGRGRGGSVCLFSLQHARARDEASLDRVTERAPIDSLHATRQGRPDRGRIVMRQRDHISP